MRHTEKIKRERGWREKKEKKHEGKGTKENRVSVSDLRFENMLILFFNGFFVGERTETIPIFDSSVRCLKRRVSRPFWYSLSDFKVFRFNAENFSLFSRFCGF